MDALTPERSAQGPPCPLRSLGFMSLDFRPFRLQPPGCWIDRFHTCPLSVVDFRIAPICASPQEDRLARQPGRIPPPKRTRHFRCGLAIRLPMLPTPSHDDAVSVSDRPENVCLKRTCTSPSLLTHPRTLWLFHHPDAQINICPPATPTSTVMASHLAEIETLGLRSNTRDCRAERSSVSFGYSEIRTLKADV